MIYLNVPGLYNSGPAHWQTLWEVRLPDYFTRVQQDDWNVPSKSAWVSRLNDSINRVSQPMVLVAHSLGCLTVAHWLMEHNNNPWVEGALLVAPADVERSQKECFQSFCPVPLNRLPVPTTVVASTNDPYCEINRAARWAAYWGSRFVCVGEKGHINSDSRLQDWPEGRSLLTSHFPRVYNLKAG